MALSSRRGEGRRSERGREVGRADAESVVAVVLVVVGRIGIKGLGFGGGVGGGEG